MYAIRSYYGIFHHLRRFVVGWHMNGDLGQFAIVGIFLGCRGEVAPPHVYPARFHPFVGFGKQHQADAEVADGKENADDDVV